MNKIIILSFLLILIFSCKKEQAGISNQYHNKKNNGLDIILDDNVKKEYISNPYNKSGYLIIRYSNLLYTVNEKRVIIPIFKGDKGNIDEKKIRDYQIEKGEIAPSVKIDDFKIRYFVAPAKKGEMKKTFHEFLRFYKNNLLKNVDIEHPNDFGQEHYEWFITYDFEYNGIPCAMEIRIMGSEEHTMRYKSVYEIQPDEDDYYFLYSIFLNAKSQYKQ